MIHFTLSQLSASENTQFGGPVTTTLPPLKEMRHLALHGHEQTGGVGSIGMAKGGHWVWS